MLFSSTRLRSCTAPAWSEFLSNHNKVVSHLNTIIKIASPFLSPSLSAIPPLFPSLGTLGIKTCWSHLWESLGLNLLDSCMNLCMDLVWCMHAYIYMCCYVYSKLVSQMNLASCGSKASQSKNIAGNRMYIVCILPSWLCKCIARYAIYWEYTMW